MVNVAQLVRASVCGTEGCGFKSHHSPHQPIVFSLGHWYNVRILNLSKNPKKRIRGTLLSVTVSYTHPRCV